MSEPLLDVPEKFNIASFIVDSHIRQGCGQRPAIFYNDKSLTYQDLYHGVNKTGNMLKELGLVREQRVMIMLPDCPEFFFAFLGVMKIGAVAVPVNTMLTSKDYAYYLQDSRAWGLIVAEEFLPMAEEIIPQAPELKEVFVVGGEGHKYQHFHQLLSAASTDLEPVETSKDDSAFWLYSSGTTGMPKGTIHLHHDMIFAAGYYDRVVTNASPEDRIFSISKLYFSYGNCNGLFLPLLSGASVILCSERPDPARVFELIAKYHPTILFSVPTFYAAMLRAAEGGLNPDFSSLRVCMSAGESLPKTLFDQWKAKFGIELFDGIGSTEAGNMYIANRAGEIRGGSAGKVVTGYEVKIVDDNYQEVPAGVVGNLKLKSDGIAAGYWNKHDKTKKTFVGEWLFTGDQFSVDEDGFYWYSGRSDDMIKVGGIWVSPIEVEGILLQYPGVQECAVVGVMDRDGLIKLAAFVVLKPGNQPGEEMTRLLRNFVKTKVSSYKAPRWINYLTELPMTSSGKIQRYKLREMSGKLLSS